MGACQTTTQLQKVTKPTRPSITVPTGPICLQQSDSSPIKTVITSEQSTITDQNLTYPNYSPPELNKTENATKNKHQHPSEEPSCELQFQASINLHLKEPSQVHEAVSKWNSPTYSPHELFVPIDYDSIFQKK